MLLLASLITLIVSIVDQVDAQALCTEAQANDALVGQTQLFGNRNLSDSIWLDQLPFYRAYGPISKITAYKATEYDNLIHDPGELKGFQFWYGPDQLPPIYKYEDGDENLFGARKPHVPGDLELEKGELITRVELQWDPISMRGVRFWTNLGRKWEWGYLDIPGATKATSSAPVPGAYLAAMRGFEGKPRARIAKKRYLIQIALVWALPTCQDPEAPPARPVVLAPSNAAASNRLATNIYTLDAQAASLIPPGVEAPSILVDGVRIQYPPPNEGLEFLINSTHMIGVRVNRPTKPLGTPTVPSPKTPPRVTEERSVRDTRAGSAVPQPAAPSKEEPEVQQRPVTPPSQQPQTQPEPCSGFMCWLFG